MRTTVTKGPPVTKGQCSPRVFVGLQDDANVMVLVVQWYGMAWHGRILWRNALEASIDDVGLCLLQPLRACRRVVVSTRGHAADAEQRW